MSRTVEFEVPVDTGFFTPVQLQPRIFTSLAWNAVSRWFRAHVVSPSRMIVDHQVGVVVLGFNMQSHARLTLASTEALVVRAGMSVQSRGKRLVFETEFADAATGEVAATLEGTLIPVRIDEPDSLAAEPAELTEELLARFAADEFGKGPPPRHLPRLLSEVQRDGALIAEFSQEFVMRRHLCEIADQWAWYELPCILEGSREPLAFGQGQTQPLLRRALSEPLNRLAAEFSRPYYWSDCGQVRSLAYAWAGQLALVHTLGGQSGSPETVSFGSVVEIY